LTPGTSYSPPPAFGRFRLLHQIGAGVLGPVFRTHDEQEQCLVAVKAFTLDITPERAAELSNHLQQVVDIDLEHPHIARPIATGVEDSVAYLAQQYVSGESLDAAIRQYGPAPAHDVLRLIGHVAEALDVAAGVGVFHGSLHPRDILVTPGETHLTGLGVSMALERIGQHGPIRRPYAAPERESGQEWGAAADVFSLAVIAYEVLTGRRALPGTAHPLPGLSDLQAQDAAALREILESAIDPEPVRRPANAREFANALAAALVDAGAAHASGDRGGGSRRKIKPRAAKLPGLDEPLMPAEAVAVAFAAPLGGSEPAPSDEASPRSRSNLVAPVAPSEGHDLGSEPPPAVEVVMPAAPAEARHEQVVDWAGVDAESESGVDETVPLVLDPIAFEPAVPLVAEPSEPGELPELRMRPAPRLEAVVPVFRTPGVTPPRAEPHDADRAVSPSLFASEPAEREPAPLRSFGPDRSVDDARDAGPLGLDLSVPRAIDPTRGGESFARSSRRFEPGEASRNDRSFAPIAMALAAGLLLGLLGGYEIGARWGQPTPATVVATQPAPAGAPAGSPVAATERPPAGSPATPQAAAAPVPPPVSVPAQSVVTSPVREPAAAAPPLVAKAPALAPGPPPGTASPAAIAPTASLATAKPRAAPAPARRTAARPATPAAIAPRKAASKKPIAAPAMSFASRPPGARVILDGKDVGTTPFTLNRVAPGHHTIELRLAGYRPWTTSITVEAGKPQRVTASLERDISR